jgi:hypothetical protein
MQSPPSIIRMTRPRRKRQTGHQAHVGEIRSAKGSGEKT